MRLSAAALVLNALVIGQTFAASAYRGKHHDHAARHLKSTRIRQSFINPTDPVTGPEFVSERREIDQRGVEDVLTTADASRILKLGVKSVGLNPTSAGGTPWIGTDGPFTNQFVNQSGEDLVLVLWGPATSWVTVNQPQLTVSISALSNKTISFPVGWSGAWAPVYNNTTLSNGQIFDTWGEGTFNPPYSVVDVSREVNMNGRSMSIVGPKCTTDMNTCVFKCIGGVDQCLTGYDLVNCANGSQAGAAPGVYMGAVSGGCGGMGDSAALTTYLG